MEQNDFERMKERIDTERNINDLNEACKRTGLTTTVFYNALKRKSFRELTNAELKYMEVMIAILNERKERIASLSGEVAYKPSTLSATC